MRLPPPFAQVVGDIGDRPHTGDGVAHQLALDGAQVFAQQVEDFLRRRYRLCAHSLSRCWFLNSEIALHRYCDTKLLYTIPVKPDLVRPVIGELHVDAEVMTLEQCNRLL